MIKQIGTIMKVIQKLLEMLKLLGKLWKKGCLQQTSPCSNVLKIFEQMPNVNFTMLNILELHFFGSKTIASIGGLHRRLHPLEY